MIELMIVLLLCSIISAGLIMSMTSGRKSMYLADAQISIQGNLRNAMKQILDDLRQSSHSQISFPADGNAYTNISFNISQGVSGSTISWSPNPITYALTAGQIIRNDGVQATVLANNVTAMSFMRQTSATNIINVNLSVRKGTPLGDILNASLSSAINLRN